MEQVLQLLAKVSEGRGILSFELGADGTGGKNLYLNDEKIHLYERSRSI